MAEENLRYKKVEKNIISPLEAVLSIGIAEAVGRGGYQGQEKYYEDKDKKEAEREKLRERRRETLLSLMPKLGNSDSPTAQYMADMNLFMKRLEGQPELQQTMMNGYTANPKAMGSFIKYIRSYEAGENRKVSAQDLKDYFIFATVGADNPDVNPADVLKNVIDPTLDLADAQTFSNLREDISTLENTSSGAFAFEMDSRFSEEPNVQKLREQSVVLKRKVRETALDYVSRLPAANRSPEDQNVVSATLKDNEATNAFLLRRFGVDAVRDLMSQNNDLFNSALRFNEEFKPLWQFAEMDTTVKPPKATGRMLYYPQVSLIDIRDLQQDIRNNDTAQIRYFEETYGPGSVYRAYGTAIEELI